ncbi:MAG: metallophosphoesterase [Firmicutes bacterium]|nr:metallophosphoesterase [Bacillota bacterium]
MWRIIAFVILGSAAAGWLYLTFCVSRFDFMQKISHGKKRYKLPLSFVLLAAVFAVFSCAMSVINAITVYMSAVMFFALFDIIAVLCAKFKGKKLSGSLRGRLAVVFTAFYLVIGFYLCHHVWQTDYNLKTDKDIKLKIAMFADSHIGTTFDGEGFAKHIKTIEAQDPDIVMIAGDFADDGSKRTDVERACEALGKMQVKYGVWFAYGNHDKGYFNGRDFTAEELEKMLKDNGIHILADEYELVDNSFYVVGRKDSSTERRKNMDELIDGVDVSKYIVVIDHEPNDYENEAASPADLVLSGHTHGGQLFPITYLGEWFDINDRTYGHEKRSNTDFIVTSGISDWALKFKTGTKSEYVIINVE